MEVITSSSSRLTIKLIPLCSFKIVNVRLQLFNCSNLIDSNDFCQVFHDNEFLLNSL